MLPPRASGRSHPRRSRSQKSSAFFARGPIPPIFVFRRIMKSGRPVQYHEWLPSDAVFGCLLWRVGLLGRLSALVSTPRDPAIPWGSPPHFRTPGSPSLPSVQTEAAPGALWPMRQGGDSCCRNHPQLPARPSVAADTRPAELCARLRKAGTRGAETCCSWGGPGRSVPENAPPLEGVFYCWSSPSTLPTCRCNWTRVGNGRGSWSFQQDHVGV